MTARHATITRVTAPYATATRGTATHGRFTAVTATAVTATAVTAIGVRGTMTTGVGNTARHTMICASASVRGIGIGATEAGTIETVEIMAVTVARAAPPLQR